MASTLGARLREHEEQKRHNLETERETNRHNVVTEHMSSAQIEETIRNNKANINLGYESMNQKERDSLRQFSAKILQIEEDMKHHRITEDQARKELDALNQRAKEELQNARLVAAIRSGKIDIGVAGVKLGFNPNAYGSLTTDNVSDLIAGQIGVKQPITSGGGLGGGSRYGTYKKVPRNYPDLAYAPKKKYFEGGNRNDGNKKEEDEIPEDFSSSRGPGEYIGESKYNSSTVSRDTKERDDSSRSDRSRGSNVIISPSVDRSKIPSQYIS